MKNGSIEKTPALKPSEDYLFLRQKGLEFIEQMGHERWTDYNLHDPGITLHENLCFAQTELGYRIGFPTTDLLAEPLRSGARDQAFFTAAEILTTLPITLNDYRRLLMDQPGIRNAWLLPRECACEVPLYPHCAQGQLGYTPTSQEAVVPKGTYDVLLEFETDSALGSLHDGKVLRQLFFGTPRREAEVEVRFPSWSQVAGWLHVPAYVDWLGEVPLASVVVELFNQNNLPITSSAELKKALRSTLSVRWKVTLGNGQELAFTTPLAVFLRQGSHAEVLSLADLTDLLTNAEGPLQTYRLKLRHIRAVLQSTRRLLDQHRNLSEDFCQYQEVGVEDVAVCADVILTPEADIEQVQARIYFEIEQYFNPPVRFYTLREMQERGVPSEVLFNGPFLRHGFLLEEELHASELRKDLRTSDILNRLMDIEGVLAVQHLVMTRYNPQGQPQLPSQPWRLEITSRHRPRLYIQRSKLLFFKNELPFLPANPDEVAATLQQLRSTSESHKLTIHENDLPLPTGQPRALDDYYPVQLQLPLNYGVSYEGLPREATAQRRAQAKQLKAYLLPFEQLLANGFRQLNQAPQLFSLDENVGRSVFGSFIDKETLAAAHVDSDPSYELYVDPAFGQAELDALLETPGAFLRRRSTFLDHLLARFGESFDDYPLLLSSSEEESPAGYAAQPKVLQRLIRDKIHFLKNYPRTSQQRARAFNYRDELLVTGLHNVSGLKQRVAHRLGLETLRNYVSITLKTDGPNTIAEVLLRDGAQRVLLRNTTEIKYPLRHEATQAAYAWSDTVIAFVTEAAQYEVLQQGTLWYFFLKNNVGTAVAVSEPYPDQATAEAARDALLAWAQEVAAAERFFVVEHLLLLPRFYGQPTLPVCLTPDCNTCTDTDPYSFRLTLVMPGWLPRFQNLHFRRYAERLIRAEAPAHLLVKVCWIGNAIYEGEGEEGLYCKVLHILETHAESLGTSEEEKMTICAALRSCARQIIDRYNQAYAEALYQHGFTPLTNAEKKKLFDDHVKPHLSCNPQLKPTAFTALKNFLAGYFTESTCAALATDTESVKDDKALCFQMNAFHQAWDEWLRTQVLLSPEVPTLEQQLTRLLSDKHGLAVGCAEWEVLLTTWGDRLRPQLESTPQVPTEADWQTTLTTLAEATIDALKTTLLFLNTPAVAADIMATLVTYYRPLREYLWAHARLVAVFGKLKSIYPPATLHDCIDGDDDQPVRLDGTVIG
ncbi:hypothetical protein GCM10027275_02940 [Rhabdobacter roseus]|uniref:Uncharacterized protein n=1 Tax=Rhabdobacter roseus TaxID=1655419 RepID=A0A840TKU4_9BACT|nr:hypothetical protein [Rhabdobacter roseus]MBB5282182.1 hypothetical protein [Rhabdobacter roseus]